MRTVGKHFVTSQNKTFQLRDGIVGFFTLPCFLKRIESPEPVSALLVNNIQLEFWGLLREQKLNFMT